MEGLGANQNKIEKTVDPVLKDLWSEYGFHGRPPFSGSVAEKRLKDACDRYAVFLDHDKRNLPGQEAEMYGNKKVASSESKRRELHNQIAVMVVGRQRSGMDDRLAREISNFAYEYSRGYKIEEN